MITNYVPGSYMTHDQLHVRGGHQVTWAIDGVPIPNTNIASNVGPQIDPKDIDTLEVQRGGYSSNTAIAHMAFSMLYPEPALSEWRNGSDFRLTALFSRRTIRSTMAITPSDSLGMQS